VIPEEGENQRQHRRIRGPFDAVRVGLLEFKLRLYDLSVGGCLIDSLTAATAQHPIRLRITLPDGNTVAVRGLIVPPPRDIGYAVRFIDLDARTSEMIERALDYALQERSQA
jgi:PilZ domain-containing protein